MGIIDNSGQDSKRYAFRIYTIIKNGPLYKSGANELTDFIIPPDEVFSNQITFEEWVKTHSNQEIILSFYSLLTKKFRDLKIKTNSLGSKEGVLGASVQKENWTVANKKVLHIISVKENSFSQKELGLIPNEDYIVGVKCKNTPIIPLNNDDFSPLEILGEVVRKNKGKSVKFYIYNREKGARDVTAKIGEDYYFTLGCDGAFGALHMFPSLEMENKTINNDKNGEIKITEENKKENGNDITKNSNKEIKEKNENEIINNSVNIENKNENKDEKNSNNLIHNNKEKDEENNLINKEDTSQNNEEIQKENRNKITINNNVLKENDIEPNKFEWQDSTQLKKNIDPKPSDNNINKIVEEMSVEKELEDNNQIKKEEKNELNEENKNEINVDNKDLIQEINIKDEKVELTEEIIEKVSEDKKDETEKAIKEIKEEDTKKEEIKKESLLNNLISYKKENELNKEEENQDYNKDDNNNQESNEKKEQEGNTTEETKKEEIIVEKTEKKRRKKRNKH